MKSWIPGVPQEPPNPREPPGDSQGPKVPAIAVLRSIVARESLGACAIPAHHAAAPSARLAWRACRFAGTLRTSTWACHQWGNPVPSVPDSHSCLECTASCTPPSASLARAATATRPPRRAGRRDRDAGAFKTFRRWRLSDVCSTSPLPPGVYRHYPALPPVRPI